jgi:hypothetical protein
MTPYNLGHLDEMEQADVIWEQGVLIGERKDEFYKILLFQVDAFYAEIYYHSHFNVIIKIVSFSDTNRLDPYLQNISLGDLLQP